jgi:hypothetical protein
MVVRTTPGAMAFTRQLRPDVAVGHCSKEIPEHSHEAVAQRAQRISRVHRREVELLKRRHTSRRQPFVRLRNNRERVPRMNQDMAAGDSVEGTPWLILIDAALCELEVSQRLLPRTIRGDR